MSIRSRALRNTATSRRVMITGIGVLTGLGEGPAATWQALLDGRSAIGPLRAYDPSPLRTRIGAEIAGFDPLRFASKRSMRMLNRGDQLGVAGATLALEDAGIATGDHRTGLFLGGNKEISRLDGLIENLAPVRREDGTADLRRLGETGASLLPPLFFVEGLQSAAIFHISEKFGIRGPNCYFAGTADSGATAIGRAMRTIRRGKADIAIAGGYDDATNWWPMSKLDSMGVMSAENELGPRAFRPFDRDRTGSVLGEGAAFVVLEERETALARGARCYAEITGYGGGNDCHRAPAPDPDGRGLSRAIRRALADARAETVSYVAAHGCATRSGDLSETRALRDAVGAGAAVSSVKPQTGHLVAAAGALNVVVAALAVRDDVTPATLNLDDPDPACDLDHVAGTPRETPVEVALALARGFEGQAVALTVAKCS